MEPQIQYCKTSDGVSIAYWTMGESGTPLVISSPLGWSHISLELQDRDLADWYEHLASRRMVVRYDPRNHGLSDREVERHTEADLTADLEAVLERLGSPQVDLLGCQGPGAPVLRVAAEHPERVRKLIVWSVTVKGPAARAKEQQRALLHLAETDWALFTNTFAATRLGWTGELASQWARFIRRAVGPRDAAIILDGLWRIDWNPWLAKIRAPVLVLRGWQNDPDTEGRWADIADVRLVDLDRRDWAKQNEVARAAIDAFLAEGEEQARSVVKGNVPSGTAIILFADIADSTALTERLGDAAFREKARELDEALRVAITSNGGTAIEGKLLGDGVLATFGAAREAIACAAEMHRLAGAGGLDPSPMTHDPLSLHVGIHAGDVIREEGNVYGGAVNIAARISSEAAAGETLVSGTVRELARTSAGPSAEGFEDRGERELKGVGEPVRVWAVRPSTGSG